MSAISTKIYAKDSSGTLRELQPETTISNVTGLQTALDGKVDTVSGKGLSTNDYTTTEKNKLAGIANNANNYVHPTTSGNKHIPSGGSSGKILGWSADGTAAWIDEPSKGTLIDIVDNGPKQLVKFNNSTSGTLVATVQSNGYSVKITGGNSTGRTVAYALANITKTGTYKFKLELSGTGASCYINDDTTGTKLKEYYASTTEDISLTAGHTYSFKTYRKGSDTNATVSIMICDKDLYAVSSAYVPYRPSYQELYERVLALENS